MRNEAKGFMIIRYEQLIGQLQDIYALFKSHLAAKTDYGSELVAEFSRRNPIVRETLDILAEPNEFLPASDFVRNVRQYLNFFFI